MFRNLMLLWFTLLASVASAQIVLDPSKTHQEMVGFGGSLTWYADRVLTNPEADAIQHLIFEDLGMDILRLQNWYFPVGYPENKDTAGMPDLTMFNANEVFYNMAKAANPPMKVLLSSWGAPAALKSNNHTRQGTLIKVNGEFAYDQYVQYWIDSLDRMSFTPDYLSMQNEPGYTNPGWTTMAWRPTETQDFAGYSEALDLLAARLEERGNSPLIIAPEAENIGAGVWDNTVNTFRAFTTPLKGKDYIHAYAYHLYQVGNPGLIEANIPRLHIVRDEFGEKMNFMTEFSGHPFGWLETAHLIQNTLIEANASAYLHWNLVWEENSPDAMIGVSNTDYVVRENYYTLKHFARHIDAGYLRIEMSGSDATAKLSAFVSPNGRRLVVHALNLATEERSFDWNLTSLPIASAQAYRSTEEAFYQDLGQLAIGANVALPAESLSTYVIELAQPIVPPKIWAGIPVDSGYVYAPWLGWTYVSYAPWLWRMDSNTWLYADEPAADAPGLWVYLPR